jgi:anti-sigma factor RsiW
MNDPQHDHELEAMKKLLKAALPPVKHAEPRHDLWPQVLRRFEAAPARIPWWDWALLGGTVAAIFLFPAILPALLFHL